MIYIEKTKQEFKKILEQYTNQSIPGFELKITHTYHVASNAKEIATKLNLSEEDIQLAQDGNDFYLYTTSSYIRFDVADFDEHYEVVDLRIDGEAYETEEEYILIVAKMEL